MNFGEKLKKLRGRKTQEVIAREIGITSSSWAMYERNERIPRDEVKIKIANFFGVSVQELFFEP
jgi:transcriptional regulator with XRE-family HTH domain